MFLRSSLIQKILISKVDLCVMSVLALVLVTQPSQAQPTLNIWTNNAPAANYFTVAVDPTNSNIIYAGGRTFFDGSWRCMVLKSTDRGNTWNKRNTGLDSTEVVKLLLDPTNANIIYAGNNLGVAKSTDGGANWSQMFLEPVGDMAMAPSDPRIIYTLGSQLHVTEDGGRNWAVRSLPVGKTQQYALAIHSIDPRIIFVSLNNLDQQGVFRSTNGGLSWQYMAFLGDCDTLRFDPADPNTVYAGGSGGSQFQQKGFYKSIDLGQSWSFYPSHTAIDTILELALDPSNPANIYLGTITGGVYRTTNGGTTWNTYNSGFFTPYGTVSGLAFDRSGTYLYAATWPFFPSSGAGGVYGVGLRETRVQSLR